MKIFQLFLKKISPPNVDWSPDSQTEQEDCCQFQGFDFALEEGEEGELGDVEDEFKDF